MTRLYCTPWPPRRARIIVKRRFCHFLRAVRALICACRMLCHHGKTRAKNALFGARGAAAGISRRHACHLCKRDRPMPCRLVAWCFCWFVCCKIYAHRFWTRRGGSLLFLPLRGCCFSSSPSSSPSSSLFLPSFLPMSFCSLIPWFVPSFVPSFLRSLPTYLLTLTPYFL